MQVNQRIAPISLQRNSNIEKYYLLFSINFIIDFHQTFLEGKNLKFVFLPTIRIVDFPLKTQWQSDFVSYLLNVKFNFGLVKNTSNFVVNCIISQ